jgi:hypothetical protein
MKGDNIPSVVYQGDKPIPTERAKLELKGGDGVPILVVVGCARGEPRFRLCLDIEAAGALAKQLTEFVGQSDELPELEPEPK